MSSQNSGWSKCSPELSELLDSAASQKANESVSSPINSERSDELVPSGDEPGLLSRFTENLSGAGARAGSGMINVPRGGLPVFIITMIAAGIALWGALNPGQRKWAGAAILGLLVIVLAGFATGAISFGKKELADKKNHGNKRPLVQSSDRNDHRHPNRKDRDLWGNSMEESHNHVIGSNVEIEPRISPWNDHGIPKYSVPKPEYESPGVGYSSDQNRMLGNQESAYSEFSGIPPMPAPVRIPNNHDPRETVGFDDFALSPEIPQGFSDYEAVFNSDRLNPGEIAQELSRDTNYGYENTVRTGNVFGSDMQPYSVPEQPMVIETHGTYRDYARTVNQEPSPVLRGTEEPRFEELPYHRGPAPEFDSSSLQYVTPTQAPNAYREQPVVPGYYDDVNYDVAQVGYQETREANMQNYNYSGNQAVNSQTIIQNVPYQAGNHQPQPQVQPGFTDYNQPNLIPIHDPYRQAQPQIMGAQSGYNNNQAPTNMNQRNPYRYEERVPQQHTVNPNGTLYR